MYVSVNKRINELIEYNNCKNVNSSTIIQIHVNDSIENLIIKYVIDMLKLQSVKKRTTKFNQFSLSWKPIDVFSLFQNVSDIPK